MSRRTTETRSPRAGWRLAPYAFWADERTVVGGDPFRSVRLTERGAHFVRGVLDGSRAPAAAPERAVLDRLLRGNLLQRPTAAPGPGGDVTLVIPARAEASTVQAVLDSAPGIPAIVVDDGSAVPLAGSLTHAGGLRVLRHERSAGPAAARNAGARACATGWVAFADADLVAAPGWIGELLAYAGDAVAIAPRITGTAGTGLAARFEHAVCALDRGAQPGFVHPSGALSYVPSAALLVDRAAFLAAGGFDESMRVGEDVDLVWRVAGEGVYYEPSVVVGHRPRPALRSAVRRRAAYGASAAALAARHPALMHHGSFPLAAALPMLLLLAGHPGLAASASAAHLALAPRSISTSRVVSASPRNVGPVTGPVARTLAAV
ncbi:glycosyltransferase, partial [Cumulibacter manganitolerans]|uniref:glycosyltransferase n=1 Tax=Cumulibacter manganitolerans TaxID=1884992 RepID=UPI001295A85C